MAPAASCCLRTQGLEGKQKFLRLLWARCWYCFLSSLTFANCGFLGSGVFSFAPVVNPGTAVVLSCVPLFWCFPFPWSHAQDLSSAHEEKCGVSVQIGLPVSVWHRKVFSFLLNSLLAPGRECREGRLVAHLKHLLQLRAGRAVWGFAFCCFCGQPAFM